MHAPTPMEEMEQNGEARSVERMAHKVKVLGDEELMSESEEDEEEEEEEELSEANGSALVLPSEHTPLLGRRKLPHHAGWKAHARGSVEGVVARVRTKVEGIVVTKEDVKETAETAVGAIPAVILGSVASFVFVRAQLSPFAASS